MKEYYVKSYYCASYLMAHGIIPSRIETTPTGKRIFYYEDREAACALADEFFGNSELQSFVGGCVAMKRAMFGE